MAFVSLHISTKLPITDPAIITTDKSYTSICDPTVTLVAAVELVQPDSIHTYLWEQTSGAPVTFDTPANALTTTITVSTYDDKTFRFWVDKGTVIAVYKEVTVYGTPTDQMSIGTIGATRTPTITHRGSSLTALAPPPALVPSYHNSTDITFCEPDPNFWGLVVFVPSENVGDLVAVELVVWAVDHWTVQSVATTTPHVFESVPRSSAVRVVYHYRDVMGAYSQFTNTVHTTPLAIIGAEDGMGVSTFGSVHPTGVISGYDVDITTLTSKTPVPDLMTISVTGSTQGTPTISAYDVNVVTLTSKTPPTINIVVSVDGSSSTMPDIFDYDVLDLTGGQIGG